LSLEIRFFQKIGFLNPRFLVKNKTIFIHGSAFLNSGIGSEVLDFPFEAKVFLKKKL
jgi:hypothetical protein